MTTTFTPRLALSEAAVALIRHAETDVAGASLVEGSRPRILTNTMGASTDPAVWLEETALLRLVSLIEAYVDSVSMHRMDKLVDSHASLLSLLLDGFELASRSSWQARHETYRNYHGISLRTLNGWGEIRAAIEVRNCLLHGLGNLTAKQRSQTSLAATLKPVDVTIGGNRMHLSRATVHKVAERCNLFVKELDGRIDIPG